MTGDNNEDGGACLRRQALSTDAIWAAGFPFHHTLTKIGTRGAISRLSSRRDRFPSGRQTSFVEVGGTIEGLRFGAKGFDVRQELKLPLEGRMAQGV